MGFVELLLTGVGLSMDAFAVAVCKGLGMRKVNWAHALVIALFFGGFQALMPLVGWAAGSLLSDAIAAFDHWIAFGLLAFIGAKMLWDAFHEEGEPCACESVGPSGSGTLADAGATRMGGAPRERDGALAGLDLRELTMMAVATSIDALAVGVTFAFLKVSILPAVAVIGLVTFALSFAGVAVGNQFGARFERPATIAGGVVLILLGAKILIEHLFG